MNKNILSYHVYYNLRNYILYVTKISNWQRHNIFNIYINISNIHEPLFNFALPSYNYFFNYNEQHIQKCLNILKKRKITVSWIIDSMMTELEQNFSEKFKLNRANTLTNVILNIKDYIVPKNYDIILQKVNSHNTLIKFDECASNIFFRKKNITKNFFRGLSKIDNSTIQFFLVKLNNEKIVGICGLYIKNNIAGFYSDGIIEKYRKQGLGAQIIFKRIEIAQQNNCSHIVAQCMNSSINPYMRLGFNMLGNLHFYV